MRQLGRDLSRGLGRDIWDIPGVEEVLFDSFQHIVLDSDGNCFTCPGAVLRSSGTSFDTVNDIASAGYVVGLVVKQADAGTSTVTTAILDTDGNTHTVAGTTTMYVFGGVPVTTKGTSYTDITYTVRDMDGNYFSVTNDVLDTDGNTHSVVGKVLNANGSQITTACGERLVVQDSDGFYHAANLNVADKDGNLHTVTSAVLDTDGNPHTVN